MHLSKCFVWVYDFHSVTYLFSFVTFQAAERLYGVEDDDLNRRLNPKNVVNFDESMGYTLVHDDKHHGKKGSTNKTERKSHRKWQQRRGYHIVFGCTMAGRPLPPLLAVRAHANSGVQPGHPVVIRITSPEYTDLFDNEGVAPLIVIYADGDKKVCGKIYTEQVSVSVHMYELCSAPQLNIYKRPHLNRY